jgi:arylsulfatase I/J
MGRGYKQSLTYLDGANGEFRSPARACATRLRLLTAASARLLARLRSLARAPTDYWTLQTTGFCDPKAYQDLWEHDRPATEMANPLTCSQANQMPNCIYEDDRVANFTLNVINAHDPATPFHMYIAWHNTHEPLEVPQQQLDKFDFVFSNCTAIGGSPNKNNSCSAAFLAATEDGPLGDLADKPCCFRQYYSAMTNYVDMHIGQVVDALKAKGMWDNTFMVVSSDNGGPIYRNGSAGGNNFPLRGGKKSNFEGGVRVNAFVTGGLVPEARRGQVEAGFAASEDWFRTLAGLAGVDPEDPKAAAAGLPPVEGYDLWPLLSGANATSPRTELWLGSGGAGDSDSSQSPILQGLIRADGYKVLWGNVIENTWTGAFYPNRSTAWCDTCPLDCGTIDAPTCLFNVLTDPTEHENVAAANPGIVQAMSARLVELSQGIFKPDRGLPDNTDACYAGDKTYHGWVGPFLP